MNSMDVVVLASGNGSTFQAIVDKCRFVNVRALISDNMNAYALDRAVVAGIPAHPIPQGQMTVEAWNEYLARAVAWYHPEVVVLAGFMRILTPEFLDVFPNRVINIHPSLLPRHRGLHTYERALKDGDEFHGTTVHLVTPELDAGPIIRQAVLDIEQGDTAETLQQKTQSVERDLYPFVLDAIADGSIELSEFS